MIRHGRRRQSEPHHRQRATAQFRPIALACLGQVKDFASNKNGERIRMYPARAAREFLT
jgi:hypothetical protein